MNASRDDLLFLHNKTPVSWASIDRWTYDEESSDGKPPPYTLYTGLDLKTFFVLFLVTNALHTLAIYIAKSLTSPTFKKDHFFIKVVHCLENTSVFLPHTDWDAEGGTVACLDIDHPPSPSLLPSDKSYNRFEPTSSYLIATIVWRRLPAIERHVWKATLVATAPHAHASVWIALSCALVDAHAAARPLVIATKPLSARPPNPLTLHTWALAKH